ncbi:hypothetical protein AK830_g1332 [Neonectria ditissima]|uniref:Uncharacterized protein n=1 Tax=Neonectria ditissima TaxID=78410 RepID=A0A0P7BX27_9HYPO|nr:hypothetical protein AK830_g1332 [Neonectria ditissima]
MVKLPTHSRNRGPCKACQASKRKQPIVRSGKTPMFAVSQKEHSPTAQAHDWQSSPETSGGVGETSLMRDTQPAAFVENGSSMQSQDAANVESGQVELVSISSPPNLYFDNFDASDSQTIDFSPWTSFDSGGVSPLFLPILPAPQSYNDTFSNEFFNTLPILETGDFLSSTNEFTRLSDGKSGKVVNTAGRRFSGSTRPISHTFNTTLDDVLRPARLTEPSLSHHRHYLTSLWNSFVEQLAPFMTPFGSHTDNPIPKYLVPEAEKNSELLVAVLHLVQIIVTRGQKNTHDAGGLFLEQRAKEIQRVLKHTMDFTSSASGTEYEDRPPRNILTLSTLMVFCMGFVATQDAVRLVFHMKYAIVICQDLFNTYSEDEGGHMHFRDLDMFSGMSTAIASILYTLGRLVKRKIAGLHEADMSHPESATAFESDVDGLEARLRRHITLLTKHRDQHPASAASPCNTYVIGCLDFVNEALLWSAWTIFLTDLKNRWPTSDPDTHGSVEHILDACAEVPEQSLTAQFLLFPLMIGGIRATKRVYREFVLNRLGKLDNIGLTDTKILCEELRNWWTAERSVDAPTALSKFIF